MGRCLSFFERGDWAVRRNNKINRSSYYWVLSGRRIWKCLKSLEWESTGFISGQMRANHLNRFTYISPKESLLKMQQRYGLLAQGNVCSATIIQGYLHIRCAILFRNGLHILEKYAIIADCSYYWILVNTYLRFSRLPHTHSLSRTGRIRRI